MVVQLCTCLQVSCCLHCHAVDLDVHLLYGALWHNRDSWYRLTAAGPVGIRQVIVLPCSAEGNELSSFKYEE